MRGENSEEILYCVLNHFVLLLFCLLVLLKSVDNVNNVYDVNNNLIL